MALARDAAVGAGTGCRDGHGTALAKPGLVKRRRGLLPQSLPLPPVSQHTAAYLIQWQPEAGSQSQRQPEAKPNPGCGAAASALARRSPGSPPGHGRAATMGLCPRDWGYQWLVIPMRLFAARALLVGPPPVCLGGARCRPPLGTGAESQGLAPPAIPPAKQ